MEDKEIIRRLRELQHMPQGTMPPEWMKENIDNADEWLTNVWHLSIGKLCGQAADIIERQARNLADA